MFPPLYNHAPLRAMPFCTHFKQSTTVTSAVPLHQDRVLVPRCSSPWAHSECTDIIISIVQEQWCLTPSKPSQPCSNNGNAKLHLCMHWITKPKGTMSERSRQWWGGAIDEHLLFIFATWSGLTGNKCVEEVNKAGECLKKSVSHVYVAVRRCCPELNSRGE